MRMTAFVLRTCTDDFKYMVLIRIHDKDENQTKDLYHAVHHKTIGEVREHLYAVQRATNADNEPREWKFAVIDETKDL